MFEIVAFVASALFLLLFSQPDGIPWAVAIPLIGGGTLVLSDAIRILFKRIEFISVRGILAVFLTLFILISPVSQLSWDYWPALPANSRSPASLLLWAWSWFIGVGGYRLLFRALDRTPISQFDQSPLRSTRFVSRWGVLMFLSLLSQAYIYIKFGGIQGFVETVSSRSGGLINGQDPFDGLGPIVAVADGSRYLLAIGLAYLGTRLKGGRSWGYFAISALLLAACFLLLGGLRGSRGVMVYGLFTYVALYHFWVRPIPLKATIVGCALFFAFMTTYYYYKFYGFEGLQSAVIDGNPIRDSTRGDAERYVLTRDLGRMDLQVLAIQRVVLDGHPLAWGRSYLGAPFAIIPDQSFFTEPPTVTKEKVELLFGEGAFARGAIRQTSLLLGQYGELVANFGLLGIILFYALWYWIIGVSTRFLANLRRGDARLMFAPALLLLPVQFVMYDSSLLVMFYFKMLLFPIILYLLVYKVRFGAKDRA